MRNGSSGCAPRRSSAMKPLSNTRRPRAQRLRQVADCGCDRMRRDTAERLDMDLRLLIALSYLGDHDGVPQQERSTRCAWTPRAWAWRLNRLEDLGRLVRRRDSEDRESLIASQDPSARSTSACTAPAPARSSPRHARLPER
jgi:DNA-binding MarR family transcriptional regulator